MYYEERKPSEQLIPFIKCFWQLRQTGEFLPKKPEVIVPDGCPEIVFNLGARFKRYHQNRTEIQPLSIVVGQIKQHVLIEPTSGVDLFGIRFEPNGLFPLLRQSVSDLTNEIVGIDVVLGRLGVEFEEQINEEISLAERIEIFESQVLRFYETAETWSLSSRATDLISQADGKSRVDHLARKLETNPKTLERHFKREIGITPKLFSRITRLQKLLQILNSSGRFEWADLAYSFGYSDQAHLIKDFREFAGTSPQKFRIKQTTISDSFVG